MLCISVAYAVMTSAVYAVRLSVTFVYSVKTSKHVFKFLSPSGSHITQVFPYQTLWQYSDGESPNGGVEWKWGRQKNCDSRIDGSCSAINNCNGQPCSLPRRPPRISESCLSHGRLRRQNFVKMFDAGKTRMIGLPYSETAVTIMLNRFHLIPERHGQTDGRTDRIAISISLVSVLTRDKNVNLRACDFHRQVAQEHLTEKVTAVALRSEKKHPLIFFCVTLRKSYQFE